MNPPGAVSPKSTRALPLRTAGVQVDLVRAGHALHDDDGDAVHLLNETAFALWQLCDGATSPEEMAASICELFGEAGAVVLDDIDRTLAELDRRGLIRWQQGTPR